MSSNGNLTSAELTAVDPGGPYLSSGGAAASYIALRTALLNATGIRMQILYPAPDGVGNAYRSYDEQVRARQIYGGGAATPGYSNHGLGTAVDVNNFTAFPAGVYASMLNNFGWVRDVAGEGWHIHYVGGYTAGPDADVLSVQKSLNRIGYSLDEDGIKGPNTLAAIKDFQAKNGLEVDGIAGPATKAAIAAIIASGTATSDPEVLEAQQLLNKVGYALVEDGIKGPATVAAIKDFQTKHGLTVDGIAGLNTKTKIREVIANPLPDPVSPNGYYRPVGVPAGTLFGIDISHYQAGFNFAAYKSGAKEDFVILKRGGSNSGTYIDSQYANLLPAARAAGLLIGHYWFNGREGVATPTASAEAFLKDLDLREGEIVALDIESEGTMPAYNAAEALEWLQHVESKLGIKPFVYMSASLARQAQWIPVIAAGYPLWVAMYSYVNEPARGTYLANDVDPLGSWGAGDSWTIHQWTSTVEGTMPGTTAGGLDRNIAKADAWVKFGYKKVTPIPDPNPDPDPIPDPTPDPDPIPDPAPVPHTPAGFGALWAVLGTVVFAIIGALVTYFTAR